TATLGSIFPSKSSAPTKTGAHESAAHPPVRRRPAHCGSGSLALLGTGPRRARIHLGWINSSGAVRPFERQLRSLVSVVLQSGPAADSRPPMGRRRRKEPR